MDTLSSLPPEYLIVVCSFTYASQGKTRYLPNEVRRFLAGKAHQTNYDESKKRPGLPEKVEEKLGSRVLVPLYFSLIKYPIKRGGRLFNAAIGAIMIYQLSVTDFETFKAVCKIISEELGKRFNKFEIIIGYGVNLGD